MIELSIVIPVYNIETWLLERCLESIVKQDLDISVYEIIIVDDGSKTEVEISERLFALLPIVVIRQENKGLGGARNTGIRLAKGEYIVFIDSDDYLFPNKLKPLLKRCLDQHLDSLIYSYKRVNSDNIATSDSQSTEITFRGSGPEYLLKYNVLGVCWQLYKTSLLRLGGDLTFIEKIYHEDELFVPLWLIRVEHLEVVNDQVYAYYNRAGSITNSLDKTSIEKRKTDFLFVIKSLENVRTNGSLSPVQTDALSRRITYLTADYITIGLRSGSISKVRKNRIKDLRLAQLFPIKIIDGENKLKIFSLLSRCYCGLWLIKYIDKIR